MRTACAGLLVALLASCGEDEPRHADEEAPPPAVPVRFEDVGMRSEPRIMISGQMTLLPSFPEGAGVRYAMTCRPDRSELAADAPEGRRMEKSGTVDIHPARNPSVPFEQPLRIHRTDRIARVMDWCRLDFAMVVPCGDGRTECGPSHPIALDSFCLTPSARGAPWARFEGRCD